MRLVAIATLLLASPVLGQPTDDEIVFLNSITIKAPNLSEREIRLANKYAHCVSFPYFPLPEELPARIEKCRKRLPSRAGSAFLEVTHHIDAIVGDDPGSEATLKVEGVSK